MFEEIKALLVKELGVEESLIKPEAELVTDLGINSLELADLVMLCEDKFDVEIEEEKLHEFITVGDVVNYLESIEK
ncbi:MAG: acyl carrier protein [Ruminococcus sp.]|nr:acyl carrier protein [Candidatus Apopatosoma intestinale]